VIVNKIIKNDVNILYLIYFILEIFRQLLLELHRWKNTKSSSTNRYHYYMQFKIDYH